MGSLANIFSPQKSRLGPLEFHPELWSFEEVCEEEGTVNDSTSGDEEDVDPISADWESV